MFVENAVSVLMKSRTRSMKSMIKFHVCSQNQITRYFFPHIYDLCLRSPCKISIKSPATSAKRGSSKQALEI
jgi:hypothetical protein